MPDAENDRFLPEGFEFDAEGRVARPCPKCGQMTYAPGPSGWASRYWLHSETDTSACPIPPGE